MAMWQIIFIGIGILLLLFFLVFLGGKIFWIKKFSTTPFSLLKISPPKGSEKNASTAEHLFSVLHGIYHPRSLWEVFTGKPQFSMSFELIRKKGKIVFIARVPTSYVSFIEGQLWAHYPESEIEKIEDYLGEKSREKQSVTWAEFSLENASIWPIKRFSQFEDKIALTVHDPLSGILLPLDHGVEESQVAGIQIAFRPFDEENFQKRATRCLEKLSLRKYRFTAWQRKYEKHLLQIGFWKRIFSLPWALFFSILRGKSIGKNSDGESYEKDVDIQTTKIHEKENTHDAASNKISRFPFEVNIRIFSITEKKKNTSGGQKILEIFSTFKQFTLPHLNGFILGKISQDKDIFFHKIKHCFVSSQKNILNTEELATLWHLPHESVQIADIDWVTNKKFSPPKNIPHNEENITLLGKANFRGKNMIYGIRPDDRRRHIYISGKTGMGKSTLLENMIFSDIQEGKGVAVVDPHGDLAEAVLQFVPKSRTNDVIIFDPSDKDFPISFNILECPNPEHKHLVASGVVGVFKKMFAESWGPRLEHILRNVLLTLIEADGQSLLGVLRILSDTKYREEILKKVSDPVVLSFWKEEFGRWQPKQVAEAISPIQNKVGQFLSSSMIRNILGQTKSSFDLRFAMDKKKIVIISLSKGKIGEDNSALLGAMLITKFQLDVMSRADIAEKDREDFYLYVDEFQNFATSAFATILSEARKYKLNLTVANQYLAQMEDEVREAIFGNVGSLITFQVGFDDAKVLSDQFGGEEIIAPSDIGGLPKYQIYIRLMIDGMPSPVFSSYTLPPPEFSPDKKQLEKIQKVAREKYAKPRKKVEDQIMKWAWSGR